MSDVDARKLATRFARRGEDNKGDYVYLTDTGMQLITLL